MLHIVAPLHPRIGEGHIPNIHSPNHPPDQALGGTGALAAVSATEKRRQLPAEEETDSRDPYHYPWSGVVAKTPTQAPL